MSAPSLYQVNTRVVLGEVAPRATLDDLPDSFLDGAAARGVGVVWMLGVWQTGPAGRHVSLTQPDWVRGYRQQLPDYTDADVCGSPFAVVSYVPHTDFGGDGALARLRQRLARRGVRLLLDFIPNHTAMDHPWTQIHPEFYVHGTEADLAAEPHNYFRLPSGLILAHGRDPYFPGWPDTAQLNIAHPALRASLRAELLAVAARCDGVRCDMAMLLLPEVFRRTWGAKAAPADGAPEADEPFWPEAVAAVRRRHPDFLFLAEVYWDLEQALLGQGFEYAYDKRLYDRLRGGDAGAVRAHLAAPLDFQEHCARFLENHDELRAAAAFTPDAHRAAAVVTYLTPGMRFFHEGQWEGRRVHASMHLARRPPEPVDEGLRAFYVRLLECLRRPEVRSGAWRLRDCRPAWEGNPTSGRFLAWTWEGEGGVPLLAAVNYGPTRGQCYVGLPLPGLRGKVLHLRDLLGEAEYTRAGDDLLSRGLYLDLPAWGHHLFEMKEVAER